MRVLCCVKSIISELFLLLINTVSHNPIKIAVEGSERTFVGWIKRLMAVVTEAPWNELQAYCIQKVSVTKNFLVSLGATFLTSSSIAVNHLDSEAPANLYIFSPEKNIQIEKAKAGAALLLVMENYGTTIGTKGNEFYSPPCWSGFKSYFIARDIAARLTLRGKKYVIPQQKLSSES